MNRSKTDRVKIRSALISVSDKTGIVEFARALSNRGVTIFSTGGTATLLRQNDILVTDVSDYTGFPELMDGRLKTLHPKVHGALLGRRGVDEEVMQEHGILPIDLLVVNLYPFKDTVDRGALLAEAIEQIDIGGPAMIRSAAKNHARVTVVVNPNDYDVVISAIEETGEIDGETRFDLAVGAFYMTWKYDAAIFEYLHHLMDTRRMLHGFGCE